jgi:cytochrome c oxidase subunit 2
MHSYVVVDDKDTFDKWLEDAGNPIAGKMSWIEGGRNTYERLGCIQCHTTNGSPLIGPSWKDMFGSDVPLADGSTVKGNEAYVHESVLEPSAKIHRGFPNIMPSFKGRIKDQEIDALIWYMKSISSHVPTDQLTAGHVTIPKAKKK